jgi:SAM-dependent methyltransferase
MEPQVYSSMAAVEDRHWWYVGRRRIIETVLAGLTLPAGAQILEVGCGTGGNLELLARYGQVLACEPDPGARRLAARRGIVDPEPGGLPHALPFAGRRFDLICMFDVLEHVDEDTESVKAVQGRLAPGGFLLVTVPAYRWLWSYHDIQHHHKRRYTRRELVELLRQSGFIVRRATYFNTFLMPAVVGVRFLRRALRLGEGNDEAMPPRFLNAVLTRILETERFLIKAAGLATGTSILVLAQNAHQ